MYNAETNDSPNSAQSSKKPSIRGNKPLIIGGVVLCVGSLLLGYTVGHRQGLSVVGYDADAQQLVDVVEKQKTAISAMNKTLNTSVQERDVAVSNSTDLLDKLKSSQAENEQAEVTVESLQEQIAQLEGDLKLEKARTANAVYEAQKSVERIQRESPDTKLYLQSLLPFDESFRRYKKLTGKTDMVPEINAQLEVLAKDHKITFINLFPLFTEKGTNVLRKELTSDGLHLNEEGYKIWVKALKKKM